MEQKQVLKRPRSLRQADTLYYNRGSVQIYGSAKRETLFVAVAKTGVTAGGKKEEYIPLGKLRLRYYDIDGNCRFLPESCGTREVVQAGTQIRSCTASPDAQMLVYRVESPEMFRLFIGADNLQKTLLMLDGGLNIVGVIPQSDGEMSFCLRMQLKTDGTVAHSQTRILIKRATRVSLHITSAICAKDGWEAAYARCKFILGNEKD